MPLLDSRCGECHNGTKRKGGLSLATYADILDGGKDGPIVRPGSSADSLLIHRLTGAEEEQMPKDERAAAAGRDRPHRALDRRRRARDAVVAAAPAPWEAPLALDRPPCPPRPGPPGGAGRSHRRRVPARHGEAQPSLVDDALFARRVYLDLWGLLPTPEELQAFLADRPRTSARGWCGRCSPTRDGTPSTGSRSGTICCATRTASPTSRRTAGRKSITPWLLRRAADEPAVRPVRRGAAQSRGTGRSRRLPDRRQLARRDQRGGDAVDAGVAEHRAGVSRRQPEVQRRVTTASSASGS